jgi:hypothetical protein
MPATEGICWGKLQAITGVILTEATWATNSRDVGAGLPQPIRSHVTAPHALKESGLALIWFFLASLLCFLLEWECLLSDTVCWNYVTFFLILYGLRAKRLPWVSVELSRLELTCVSVGTVKTMGTAFCIRTEPLSFRSWGGMLWLEYQMCLPGLRVWALGPQLVVLFGEDVETSGSGA